MLGFEGICRQRNILTKGLEVWMLVTVRTEEDRA